MTARMNTLRPAEGAKKQAKRRGRGMGSGCGKTGGRGHKGQRSRSGGGVPAGFEGGQMPLHRRLPKFGFTSRQARFNDEVRLDVIGALDADVVDLAVLKERRIVSKRARRVKVIATGELARPVKVRGLAVTAGARAAIESAGGDVQD